MAEIMTNPTSEVSISPNREALLDTLDTLLERYLHLIDTYTTAQKTLASHLQNGYLSLAKANFSSNHTKFGQDYYDERIQALRRVRVEESQGGQDRANKGGLRVVTMVSGAQTQDSESGKVFEKEAGVEQLPSPPTTPATDDVDADGTDAPLSPEPEINAEVSPIKDPIRMFGILVPPALRSAQSDFTAAVTSPIPELINVNREMRTLENEISRLRKQIRKI